MTKTCSNCPAFLGRDAITNQERVYGKSLGVPACPRMGKLLGSDSMDQHEEAAYQEEVAEKCSSYGKPLAGSKTIISLSIGVGVPKTQPQHQTNVNSCRSCHFFVPSGRVEAELGVRMGMCAKFGKLLPETKCADVASQCRTGTRLELGDGVTPDAHHTELLSTMHVDPLLKKYMGIQGDVIESAIEVPEEEFVDPVDYPSDMPVTQAHIDKGIRAWRKLSKNNKHVFLPVFNLDFFSDTERAHIPRTGDDEHPELYVDHLELAFTTAVLWRELDETPALHGVAGTGKTEFFRYMAWMMCLPFERVSITRSSELDDLAGKTEFEEGRGTYFRHGRIPQAWQKPCVIVLDEPNVGPPDVWQFIRPLTDNSKQLVLDQNAGEVINRNDHAYLGMAMNPAWDMRNIGAEVISDADGSRLMHIFVSLPPEKIERQMIRARCQLDKYEIDDEILSKIMRIAKQLRALSEEGTLSVTWGIRPQIKVARATKFFDLRTAYRLAASDYLEPSQAEMILDVVKNG